MPKSKSIYRCQSCGYSSQKWLGRCPECDKWNSFTEEQVLSEPQQKTRRLTEFSSKVFRLNEIQTSKHSRIMTGIGEFDRILGGGLMPSSIVLLGGSPGIGKSTLMLQVASNLSGADKTTVLYVSGEESPEQVKIRSDRLGVKQEGALYFASETNLEVILEMVKKVSPRVLIIDSVQTVFKPDLSPLPGSVGQIRECAQEFLNLAKGGNITVFLLGHITKGGEIAGPKILEHIVDTVLYFETETNSAYRILRAYKNRFGPTSEIGVFEMKSSGLKEVPNPSEILLSERKKDMPGSCVVSIIEGTRPLLLEIQALITRTNFGMPRRVVTGYDYNRANLLISVLEKRLNLPLEGYDIYINVAGGIKVEETGVDLGICAAIHSAYTNEVCPPDAVYIGEVGLLGEIRSVGYVQERINEIEKLGFKKVYLPKSNMRALEPVRGSGQGPEKKSGITLTSAEFISEVLKPRNPS